jgi:hypothetical protein
VTDDRRQPLYRVARAGAAAILLSAAVVVQAMPGGAASPAIAEPTDSPLDASAAVMLSATPERLLKTLLQALPPGTTSHYVTRSAPDLVIRTYLDDGSGPGLIQLRLTGTPHPLPPQASSDSWRLPSGNAVTVSRVADNCLQSLQVDVQRPNGVVVSLDVASCLIAGGVENRPGRSALTQEQAIAIADDPAFDRAVPR